MSKTIKCWIGLHKLEYKKYKHSVPPFTLPRYVCKLCGKIKYKITGDEL